MASTIEGGVQSSSKRLRLEEGEIPSQSEDSEEHIPEEFKIFRNDDGTEISEQDYANKQEVSVSGLQKPDQPAHAAGSYALISEKFSLYSSKLYISGIQNRLSIQQTIDDISSILGAQNIEFCPIYLQRAIQRVGEVKPGGNLNHSIMLPLKRTYVFRVVPNIGKKVKRLCQTEFGNTHVFQKKENGFAAAVNREERSAIKYTITAFNHKVNLHTATSCAVLSNGSWDEDMLSQQIHSAIEFFGKILPMIANHYELAVVATPYWASVIDGPTDAGCFNAMTINIYVCSVTYSDKNTIMTADSMRRADLESWWKELGFKYSQEDNAIDIIITPIFNWHFLMVKSLMQVKHCPFPPDFNCWFHTAPAIRIDTDKNTKMSEVLLALQATGNFPAKHFLYGCVQQMWIPRFNRRARGPGDVIWLFFNQLSAVESKMWDQTMTTNEGAPLRISRIELFHSPGARDGWLKACKNYTKMRNKRVLPQYAASSNYIFNSANKLMYITETGYRMTMLDDDVGVINKQAHMDMPAFRKVQPQSPSCSDESTPTQIVSVSHSIGISTITQATPVMMNVDVKLDKMMQMMMSMQVHQERLGREMEKLKEDVKGQRDNRRLQGITAQEYIYPIDIEEEEQMDSDCHLIYDASTECGQVGTDHSTDDNIHGIGLSNTADETELLDSSFSTQGRSPIKAAPKSAKNKMDKRMPKLSTNKIAQLINAAFPQRVATLYSSEIKAIKEMLSKARAKTALISFLGEREETLMIRQQVDRGRSANFGAGILPYLLKVIMCISSEGEWPPEPLKSLQYEMLSKVCFVQKSTIAASEGLFMNIPDDEWSENVKTLLYPGEIVVDLDKKPIMYAHQLPKRWYDCANKLKVKTQQRYIIGDIKAFLPKANFHFINLKANHIAFNSSGCGGLTVLQVGLGGRGTREIFNNYDPNRNSFFIRQMCNQMMISNLSWIADLCKRHDAEEEGHFILQVSEQLCFELDSYMEEWQVLEVDVPEHLRIVSNDLNDIVQIARGYPADLADWIMDMMNREDSTALTGCSITHADGPSYISLPLPLQWDIPMSLLTVSMAHPLYEIRWTDLEEASEMVNTESEYEP